MPSAPEIFAAWVREEIAPLLRDRGYKGTGQNFHRRFGANWGIVSFQRSQWGSSQSTRFAVNLGTASSIVIASRGMAPDEPPNVADCQWFERLGRLVSDRDVWWNINDNSSPTDLAALAIEVRTGLAERGLVEIERHVEDAELLQVGLHNTAGGYMGLDATGVLLHSLGGSAEQRQEFARQVAEGRKFKRAHESDFRPAQGPKRIANNLARLGDPRIDRRAEAAYELGRASATPEILGALRARLDDDSNRVRVNAARALADLDDTDSIERLLGMLRSEPDRYLAVDLGESLGALATRRPAFHGPILVAIEERLDRAVGYDLVGFGVLVDELGTPKG